MATSAREGRQLRSGKRPVLPPPLPPRTLRRGHPFASANDLRYVGSIVAVVATLDMDAIRRLVASELPPEIKWAVQPLSNPEWIAIRDEAIRAQNQFIEATCGTNRHLRRSEPCGL